MRIIFFTYDIPYPLDSGGKIRAYNLLKEISSKFEISLFSFYRKESQLAACSHLQQICKSVTVFKRRSVNSPLNLLYLPAFPFPVSLYYDKKITRALKEEIRKKNCRLLHLESFYTSLYLNYIEEIPQILGTENIEWLIYQNYARKQNNVFIRKVLNFEISRIKKFEIESWKKSSQVISVSEENASVVYKETGKKPEIIANGIDISHFKKIERRDGRDVIFVGNFNYLQNQDAAIWIIKEIWPKVFKNIAQEKRKLIIIGKDAKLYLSKFKTIGVELIDGIYDIREVYKKAALVLAPLRVGSGTKFKILEALASGLPVVTTSLGAEGIVAPESWGIVANDPDKIAKNIINLLGNEKLRTKLGDAGFQIIQKHFSWAQIGKKLIKSYEKVINNYC